MGILVSCQEFEPLHSNFYGQILSYFFSYLPFFVFNSVAPHKNIDINSRSRTEF